MTFRIRIGKYARAYTPVPRNPIKAMCLLLRGWRPFQSVCVSSGVWWSKPSPNQKLIETKP